MKSPLLLAALVVATVGCATPSTPVAEAGTETATPITFEEPEPRGRTLRLGFWEFDLVALDLEPARTTFRLLDIRIFKLLEIGSGEDFFHFNLVESPDLLNVLTLSSDGAGHERRVVDVQALALALYRDLKESERKSELHLVKLPILGSLYAYEQDGPEEFETFVHVFRHEIER